MAIEWTPEKVNACAALYGKVNWELGVGDRCVKYSELGNDPQDIELVNSVGGDSTEFMRGKIWLLTSDDVEKILCSMGYSIRTSTTRLDGVGGIAHSTNVTLISNGSEVAAVTDSDPHFARLKILQRVVNNVHSNERETVVETGEETSDLNE